MGEMSQEGARAQLLVLARQADEVAAALASEQYTGLGKLNQVAWLGERAVHYGPIIRAALNVPAAKSDSST